MFVTSMAYISPLERRIRAEKKKTSSKRRVTDPKPDALRLLRA